MEPQSTFREHDVSDVSQPCDLNGTWAYYASINITSDQSEPQTATRDHSYEIQWYCLDVEIVRLVNSRRVQTHSLGINRALFKVLPSVLPSDYSEIANYFKDRLFDVYLR